MSTKPKLPPFRFNLGLEGKISSAEALLAVNKLARKKDLKRITSHAEVKGYSHHLICTSDPRTYIGIFGADVFYHEPAKQWRQNGIVAMPEELAGIVKYVSIVSPSKKGMNKALFQYGNGP